jgi:hypothetical protein
LIADHAQASIREAMAVTVIPGLAHDRDDLLDRRRISRVALSLGAWGYPDTQARAGRRRPTATGGVQQRLRRRHGSRL